MPDHAKLESAMELLHAGNIEKAREQVELLIRADRSNIAAWQAYAESWSQPKDKIRVWEVCLRYNLGNPQAQLALAQLRPIAPGKKEVIADVQQALAQPKDGARSGSSLWLLGAILGLFMLLALAGLFVLRGSAPKNPEEYLHTQPVTYYLYVPDDYSADQEWPLFVGIHGAGGNGLECWNLWQSHAEKEGFILLCPSIPGDSSGFYQDVAENTVWSAVGEVKKDYRVKQRMFFSGFSAGAFFIQGFTYHYPQYVSGLSILSAGVYLDPSSFAELIPVLVVIGDRDDPVAVQTSQMFVNDLKGYGFDIHYEVLKGVGHTVTNDGVHLTLDLFRKTIGK